MERSIVKAKVKVKGLAREIEDVVLVDTGAIFSIIDEELANEIGVKYIEELRKIKLHGICCEVEGRLATIEMLTVEGVVMGPSTVVVTKLSNDVKKTLKNYQVFDKFILGVRDIVGFTIDITTGRLKWVGYFIV